MVQLLLIPHLLIKDDQFSFDLTALGQLSIEPLLDLNDFDLLDSRGIFLQFLRDLLDHLNLLLDLKSDGDQLASKMITIGLSESSLFFALCRCLSSMLLNRGFRFTGLSSFLGGMTTA